MHEVSHFLPSEREEGPSGAGELPLVSVVIPFHSNLAQLRAALHSILYQTHSRIETLIVHDDPSTEVAPAIPPVLPEGQVIRVMCQHRHGAGMARNFGIEHATGDYVAFLDSDDLFLPTKIERQLRFMLDRRALASHTSYFAHGIGGRMRSFYMNSAELSGRVFPRIIGYNTIAMPTAMIRRDVLDRHRFPDEPGCEDYLFWLELAVEHEILGLAEPLSVILVSPDSVAYNSVKQHAALSRIIALVEQDPRFRCHGAEIDELRAAARYHAERAAG